MCHYFIYIIEEIFRAKIQLIDKGQMEAAHLWR